MPGAFGTDRPKLLASPLRGRIWASWPSGTATAKPQGILAIPPTSMHDRLFQGRVQIHARGLLGLWYFGRVA